MSPSGLESTLSYWQKEYNQTKRIITALKANKITSAEANERAGLNNKTKTKTTTLARLQKFEKEQAAQIKLSKNAIKQNKAELKEATKIGAIIRGRVRTRRI